MPRESRVNIRLDPDVAERLSHAADTISSTPAGITQMLIRWYLGDATTPPPRPHPSGPTTQETTTHV
jgi:hypothetical protein